MASAWLVNPPEKPSEPWACPYCPGAMQWFASDLRMPSKHVDHKFVCNKCGGIEHVAVPFNKPKAA